MLSRDIGWYVDPADSRRHRFWTGLQWVTQEEWQSAVADAARREPKPPGVEPLG